MAEQPEASGVQQLIDRLSEEGVSEGEREAERIVAEARQKANDILDSARQQASEILQQARLEADHFRAGGEEALLADVDRFAFIEANARLQVEHTVTEEIYDIDIVELQLKLASGAELDELLPTPPQPRGQAIQLRINTETMQPD